ncbi:hypothetical protein B0H17DRAFT_1132969 [Mycena rosella]|uniref:Uncharacterized protein n=1 Tax=Mycena rosella TaxID=1033263 RepID=A0AAD7GK24_MYCRO|nr:hypothetical protein B0H17DRAFT_1132969 [Mycena rosella]
MARWRDGGAELRGGTEDAFSLLLPMIQGAEGDEARVPPVCPARARALSAPPRIVRRAGRVRFMSDGVEGVEGPPPLLLTPAKARPLPAGSRHGYGSRIGCGLCASFVPRVFCAVGRGCPVFWRWTRSPLVLKDGSMQKSRLYARGIGRGGRRVRARVRASGVPGAGIMCPDVLVSFAAARRASSLRTRAPPYPRGSFGNFVPRSSRVGAKVFIRRLHRVRKQRRRRADAVCPGSFAAPLVILNTSLREYLICAELPARSVEVWLCVATRLAQPGDGRLVTARSIFVEACDARLDWAGGGG